MFCTKCGVQLEDAVRFCSQCGAPTGRGARPPVPGVAYNRLIRPLDDRKVAGVCSGIARYMGTDVTLIRILAVILAIWPPGVGLIAYIVCWIVIPNEPLALPAPAQPITTT